MDQIMDDSIENKNTFNDITSGTGIFCGQPEITGRIGCLIILAICVISTIFSVWNSIVNRPIVGDDILLSAILILITLSAAFFTVFSFKYPTRSRKKLVFEGIWFSKDKVWLGEHEIELEKEYSINDLMNKDGINRIHANWNQTNRVSCMDISETSMVLQIVNAKHDRADYRIEKIYTFNGNEGLHYDFVSTPTVLLINGILYPCNKLTLIDQLKKIAESMDHIQKEVGICNLAINIQDNSLGNLVSIIEGVDQLNKALQNEVITNHTMSILQKGEFIDKENSDFLIKLMEKYRWKIVCC